MKALILIFIGGGTGSVLRYLISILLKNHITPGSFPWATFTVNILGCFLIGFLSNLFVKHFISYDLKALLIIGLCGGFTTFSTFSNESIVLFKEGYYINFFTYIIGSIIIGMVAVLAGLYLSELVNR